jgi:hypothetical protein
MPGARLVGRHCRIAVKVHDESAPTLQARRYISSDGVYGSEARSKQLRMHLLWRHAGKLEQRLGAELPTHYGSRRKADAELIFVGPHQS